MPVDDFTKVLDETAAEFERFLLLSRLGESSARDLMLEQMTEAFALRSAELMDAERVSFLMVDRRRGELWRKLASGSGEGPVDVRLPLSAGITGRAAREGRIINTPCARREPDFSPDIDSAPGLQTHAMLCVPLRSSDGEVFAVAQLVNKRGGNTFGPADEKRFVSFTESIGLILEAWSQMTTQPLRKQLDGP